MSRVIGSSPFIQFDTNDTFKTRFNFNRSTLHSYVVSSPRGENGETVHIYTINLMPAPLTQMTAFFTTEQARDRSLLELMERLDIEDKLTQAKMVTA